MNANLPQKTLAISDWVTDASSQLKVADIPSSRLDAEIILAHTLRKSRTFLHAHGEDILSPRHIEIADARLQLRLDRTPIAYIIGHKEFYGRMFRVTPATLIPRPESETIVTMVKEISTKTPIHTLVDVGTGSGCLGISVQLELPNSDVTLLDISHHALKVAETNADQLGADIRLQRSDLLSSFTSFVDIIVANLPYVDTAWERSPETNYEPRLALFADHNGLALIEKLIPQAADHLLAGGTLLLEADPLQHDAIVHMAQNHGFSVIEIRDFIIRLQKS